LNTGLDASTTCGTGLKAKLKFWYWISCYFSYWSLSHLPFRSKDLQHGLFVPSRSLECQKEGVYFFRRTM